MADGLVRYGEAQSVELARVELNQARARLAVAARGLKADLQWLKLPTAVTASIKRQPLLWLGGAFAVGALLGTLSRRHHGDE